MRTAVDPIASPISQRRNQSAEIAAVIGDEGWYRVAANNAAETMNTAIAAPSMKYSGQCSDEGRRAMPVGCVRPGKVSRNQQTAAASKQHVTRRSNSRQRMEEQCRLDEPARNGWKSWGPYLSERQWGTVREDYSAGGNAWESVSHDASRSRAYRWGEDGICGISDDQQILCFAIALWNQRDPILKERLFGLTNSEGNHGEDVKEYYFYIDSTPTHSYMKYLYKYPQREYPYGDLIATNRGRSREAFEYKLLDTGVFKEGRYFDVFVEYAKATPEDVLIRITVHNRGPEAAELHVLPTLWFRDQWSWQHKVKPSLSQFGGDPKM